LPTVCQPERQSADAWGKGEVTAPSQVVGFFFALKSGGPRFETRSAHRGLLVTSLSCRSRDRHGSAYRIAHRKESGPHSRRVSAAPPRRISA